MTPGSSGRRWRTAIAFDPQPDKKRECRCGSVQSANRPLAAYRVAPGTWAGHGLRLSSSRGHSAGVGCIARCPVRPPTPVIQGGRSFGHRKSRMKTVAHPRSRRCGRISRDVDGAGGNDSTKPDRSPVNLTETWMPGIPARHWHADGDDALVSTGCIQTVRHSAAPSPHRRVRLSVWCAEGSWVRSAGYLALPQDVALSMPRGS